MEVGRIFSQTGRRRDLKKRGLNVTKDHAVARNMIRPKYVFFTRLKKILLNSSNVSPINKNRLKTLDYKGERVEFSESFEI